MTEQQDDQQIRETIRRLITELGIEPGSNQSSLINSSSAAEECLPDLGTIDYRQVIGVRQPADSEGLRSLRRATAARIAVGRTGPRYRTESLLRFRADHALAMDAVFTEISRSWLDKYQLPVFQTLCDSKDVFLTRPDLGRQFEASELEKIKKLASGAKVVVYVADGLSTAAVEANSMDALKSLTAGLEAKKITVAPPFFVHYGRVGTQDAISEATDCEAVCVLIGERPGLITNESMSAYLAYRATVNMPEARRTVVSNIHRGGTPAVEAGSYISEILEKMLERRVSGVELKL